MPSNKSATNITPEREDQNLRFVNLLCTGCPKKKGDPCLRAIEGTRIGLKTKVGRVLENSGNFLSNEHKNSPILWKNSWENWGQTWLPPLENMALSEVTLQINPLPFMKFWSQMRKKGLPMQYCINKQNQWQNLIKNHNGIIDWNFMELQAEDELTGWPQMMPFLKRRGSHV